VRVAAGDEDLIGLLGERQHGLALLSVLEQHERLAYGLARDGAVVLRAELLGEARVGERVLEQPHGELDAEDAADGVVYAVEPDLPLLDLLHNVGDELGVVVGDHDHVDAGVDGLLDGVVVVLVRRRGDPVHGLPVRDHEPAEVHLALERVRDEELVLVHLHAVPARVGDHHRRDALDHRVVVGGHVDAHQVVEAQHRVVLVDPPPRAAVPHEVLRAPGHLLRPAHVRHALGVLRGDVALKAGDHVRGHELHQPSVLAVALVAPTPPRVTAHLNMIDILLSVPDR
jgi:hypothetical protein